MGKNKLKKFAEMQSFSCVFQYPWAVLEREGFPLIGKWGAEYFGNDNPIVLELGCGKGEYTVGLARKYPEKNFIGIDIKGARIWTGAKAAETDACTLDVNADKVFFGVFARKTYGVFALAAT